MSAVCVMLVTVVQLVTNKSAHLVLIPLLAMVMKLVENALDVVYVTTLLVVASASVASLVLVANTRLL